MTLMKSLLLGSAAGIVGIASAQAADLPTRKGAPAAEYVRICSISVNGTPVVGWTLPGSDTCFKLTGYVTGQIGGGNIKDGQLLAYGPGASIPLSNGLGPILVPTGMQVTTPTRGLEAAGSTGRPDFGWNTRLNFGFDAVSNTAYGPLTAHAEMQFENSNGFGNDVSNPLGGSAAYLNLAYVTWAGITAGKAPSFYSFTGGGAGWYNFFSPDQQGFNQPDLLAYTAAFGGGFSATIAAQSPGSNGGSGGGTDQNGVSGNQYDGLGRGFDYQYNGQSIPDFVANLKVVQGWGSAQISGVGHYVDVTGFNGLEQRVEGWGIDAGVSFNIPQFGVGDKFLVTGTYTQNAAWYSGFPDAMFGELGAVSGNGQQMAIADTYENPSGNSFARPDMWTVSAEFDHHFSPQFVGSLEGSYGQVRWQNTDFSSVVSNSNSWLAGVVAHWFPMGNSSLDFEFETLYMNSQTQTPNGFIAGAPGSGFNTTFQGRGDGFESRFEVTRNW
ncbi:MAG: porin [Roseiarcus sp.]